MNIVIRPSVVRKICIAIGITEALIAGILIIILAIVSPTVPSKIISANLNYADKLVWIGLFFMLVMPLITHFWAKHKLKKVAQITKLRNHKWLICMNGRTYFKESCYLYEDLYDCIFI